MVRYYKLYGDKGVIEIIEVIMIVWKIKMENVVIRIIRISVEGLLRVAVRVYNGYGLFKLVEGG